MNKRHLLAAIILFPGFTFAANASEETLVMPDKTGQLHWLTRNNNDPAFHHEALPNVKKLTAPLPYEEVKAGGIGGNEQTGFIYYDGETGANHGPALRVQRNPLTKTCYLQNANIIVRDWKQDLDVVTFPCDQPDPNHHNLYWNNSFDLTNGAYNPAIDAFAIAQVANDMVETTFSQPLWTQWPIGKVPTVIFIHSRTTYFDMGGMFNDGSKPWVIYISDGDGETYPWTTVDGMGSLLGVGNALGNWGFAWGLGNGPGIAQSYIDIFAKVIQYTMTGQVDWRIGATTYRGWGRYNIRYMDKPSQDCWSGKTSGANCSLDDYAVYKTHYLAQAIYGAGLLNKVVYSLATAPGWDMLQTFKLLNHASYYWDDRDFVWDPNSDTWPQDHLNYHDVFCSLLTAAKDYQLSAAKTTDIVTALAQVNFDATTCNE